MSLREFLNEVYSICDYNGISDELQQEKYDVLKKYWKRGDMSVDDVYDIVFNDI